MQITISSEILALKNQRCRLIGIDYGQKHVGVSLSDFTWTIATPYKTFSQADLLQQFRALVKSETIVGLVIGWPVNMNGTVGPQCEAVAAFVKKLLKQCELPVCIWDERLSTMAVHRTMIEADLSRKRQKEVVDKMAASYMLQGFLESLR